MLSKTERSSANTQNKSFVKHMKENVTPSVNYYSEKSEKTTERKTPDVNLRINILEQNLNRVCLQQDALMPLLGLLDFVPLFNKNENGIKGIIKRLDDNEHQIAQHSQLLDQIQNTRDENHSNQLDELLQKIGYIDESITTLQTSFEEQLQALSDEFTQESQKFNESISQLKLRSIPMLPNPSDQKLDQHQLEIQNLYREIEGLKSCLEFIDYKEQQDYFQEKLQSVPQIDDQQKMLYLTCVEAERCIKNIDLFEESTTNRMLTQLKDTLKCTHNQKLVQQNTIQLKYQLMACKMKYYKDFDKVSRLFKQIQLQSEMLPKSSSLHLSVQENINQLQTLDDDLSKLASRSKINIEKINQQIHQIKL